MADEEEERRRAESVVAAAAGLAFEAKRGVEEEEGEAETDGKEEEGMSVWWSIEWLPKSVGSTNALFPPHAPPLSRISLLPLPSPPLQIKFSFLSLAIGALLSPFSLFSPD